MDGEMVRLQPEDEEAAARVNPRTLLQGAFRELTEESRALALATRYETRLFRMHERARASLRQLQEERMRKSETAAPVSPAPVPSTPDAPAKPLTPNPEPAPSLEKSERQIEPAACRLARQIRRRRFEIRTRRPVTYLRRAYLPFPAAQSHPKSDIRNPKSSRPASEIRSPPVACPSH
jgi:hypothetical protein